jgi:hypothetical protein
MEYKTLRERIEEQAVSNNDLSQKEIDKNLKDTLQNLKELSDESALYSTSNLMRELQIIRNGYKKGE